MTIRRFYVLVVAMMARKMRRVRSQLLSRTLGGKQILRFGSLNLISLPIRKALMVGRVHF